MLTLRSRVNSCENLGKTPSPEIRMRIPMIMWTESSTLSAKRRVDRLTPEAVNTWDLLKKAFIQSLGTGPIPGMTPTQALTAIQTMADHSQKWHDRTSSRNLSSSSNTDGLAAIVSKLDNLGRDMKKLKENVHAIQVEC
ncbi:hypothetical protein Tco_0183598 [Tanacetum coccineum]